MKLSEDCHLPRFVSLFENFRSDIYSPIPIPTKLYKWNPGDEVVTPGPIVKVPNPDFRGLPVAMICDE
jgi:hypothetical protein